MDSHVFRKAAWRLPALADLAVLRFNTRGTSSVRGTSEGAFDNAVGERFDVAAAIEYAEFAELPNIWLVGWSFGTDLALKYGCDPAVAGAILLSPPLRFSDPEDLAAWAESGRPLTALVPEFDDYLRPAEARERFAAVPQAEVVGVPGAKHLWVGDAETRARRDRPAGQPGGRRCRCRRPGTARWRPATSARTPTGRWPPSPTPPSPARAPARRADPPGERSGRCDRPWRPRRLRPRQLSGHPGAGAPPRAGSAGARPPSGSRSARRPRPAAPPRAARPAARPPR